jgi:hypothetical protein
MTRRMRVLAAGLALWSSAALADSVEGLSLKTRDELLSVCSEGEYSDIATGACLAYIAAAADCYAVTLCRVPKGVTRVQARDVVIQYLRTHPKDRHDLAIRQTWLALARAWPCYKQQGQQD